MKRVLLAFAAVLALAGCGGESEEGTSRHEVAGFELSVPGDWRAVKAGDVLSGEEIEKFRSDNPELGQYIDAVTGPDSPVKFLAFDPDVEQGFATNVNVVVIDLGREVSFQQWERAAVAEIEGLESRTSEIRRVRDELPAGECLRLDYEQEFQFGDGARTVSTRQYGFVAGERSYILTFTTLPERLDGYDETFHSVAESFRI